MEYIAIIHNSVYGLLYCDADSRIHFWEGIKNSIFVQLLTSDEISYLSGKNPQKINYFFNSAPEQIIRQTCQSPVHDSDIVINNLINYELENYEKLKKAYIEFVRSMIYKKLSASSTSVSHNFTCLYNI